MSIVLFIKEIIETKKTFDMCLAPKEVHPAVICPLSLNCLNNPLK